MNDYTPEEKEWYRRFDASQVLRHSARIVNVWLDKHPIDPRRERNLKTVAQIEQWAENLQEYGEIEQPSIDFADCPDSMDCCDI